jgi:hypothetical protein
VLQVLVVLVLRKLLGLVLTEQILVFFLKFLMVAVEEVVQQHFQMVMLVVQVVVHLVRGVKHTSEEQEHQVKEILEEALQLAHHIMALVVEEEQVHLVVVEQIQMAVMVELEQNHHILEHP